MYWLGIDTGTGGTRALLIDKNGTLAFAFTAPHEDMCMQQPLWAEQRPENWWDAAQTAIKGVLNAAKIGGNQVGGIGLTGQMHGLTLLDENSQVIRPALIWCDQRSQAQVDAINERVGRENVLAAIANPVLTGFTLPKLMWVRDHEPANYDRIRKLLLPKDYIRYQLTGEFASDVSDASGTALFDVVHRRWSNDLVSRLGINRDILPYVYESPDISGRVSEKAAQATGLKAGTPVAGGAGDQAAGAVGSGIVEPGILSCTIGTSGVVFAHTDKPVYDPDGRVHTFCHAVPGMWHVMGVTQGAGLSLQWYRNQIEPGTSYDNLTKEAAGASCGSQGLFWLPYLMGERTPHLDSSARGGWIGLTAKHTRADLVRSVIEGVSFSQKDCLDVIEEMGVPVKSVRLSGGGAQSAFWRQMLADVFSKPVSMLETQEGSAYGAALLALVSCGVYDNVQSACKAAVHETERLEPRVHESQNYARAHQVYQALYPTLKPIYRLIQNSHS